MRKLVAGLMMSLDGVVESPENWARPYFNGEMQELIDAGVAQADAILLGRRTYLEFAELWPNQDSEVPLADFMNETPKYVVSSTLETHEWGPSSLVRRDLAQEVGRLKRQAGKNIQQPQAGAIAAARSAARSAQPHARPHRGRVRHASVRRHDRLSGSRACGVEGPQHRRAVREVPTAERVARPGRGQWRPPCAAGAFAKAGVSSAPQATTAARPSGASRVHARCDERTSRNAGARERVHVVRPRKRWSGAASRRRAQVSRGDPGTASS
jgi:hypothetical protein